MTDDRDSLQPLQLDCRSSQIIPGSVPRMEFQLSGVIFNGVGEFASHEELLKKIPPLVVSNFSAGHPVAACRKLDLV